MMFMVFGGALIFTFMGRRFKMGDAMTGLLAAAFSMCGVSACIAIAPMVRAKSEEVAYAMAVSVTFGLCLPFCASLCGQPAEHVQRCLRLAGRGRGAQFQPGHRDGVQLQFRGGKGVRLYEHRAVWC